MGYIEKRISIVEVTWGLANGLSGADTDQEVLEEAGLARQRNYNSGESLLILPYARVYVMAVGDYGAKSVVLESGLAFMPLLSDAPATQYDEYEDDAIQDALETAVLMGVQVDLIHALKTAKRTRPTLRDWATWKMATHALGLPESRPFPAAA